MREFAEAASEFGGLDGVVANAGAGAVGGVLDTLAEVWRSQCDVKLASVLNLVEPAASLMNEGAVVAMLLSPRSSYVVGAVVDVSGGI